MFSINSVTVSGNLTRDPELRATPSGTAVLNGGLAYNARRKGQSGEWEDVPNFFDFAAFGKTAEQMARLKKGDKLVISGELVQRSWQTKEGERRSKVEITVRDYVDFPRGKQQQAYDLYDEDVPFD